MNTHNVCFCGEMIYEYFLLERVLIRSDVWIHEVNVNIETIIPELPIALDKMLFSTKKYWAEALLMSTHNICFRGEIKIFPGYPPVSRPMITQRIHYNKYDEWKHTCTKTQLYNVMHIIFCKFNAMNRKVEYKTQNVIIKSFGLKHFKTNVCIK